MPKTRTSLGMPGPEPTMMLSAVVPSICAAVTFTPPRAAHIERRKACDLRLESGLAACRLARVGDDHRRVVLAGADDEIEDVVVIDVAHGDAQRALEPGKGRHRRDEPVAVAVVDVDLGRTARRSLRRHRVARDGRDDVDQRHEPVVFVVEAMAVHDEEAGVVLELGAYRQSAGLDGRLARTQCGRRHIGVVDLPHFRPRS